MGPSQYGSQQSASREQKQFAIKNTTGGMFLDEKKRRQTSRPEGLSRVAFDTGLLVEISLKKKLNLRVDGMRGRLGELKIQMLVGRLFMYMHRRRELTKKPLNVWEGV